MSRRTDTAGLDADVPLSPDAKEQHAARLSTVNISGPSVERAGRLLPFLLGLQSDALVLTETRQNQGTVFLLEGLRAAGYTVIAPVMTHPGERGVAVAHRLADARTRATSSVELAHRLVVTELDMPHPITLVGAYVPSRDASAAKIARKRLFLEQMSSTIRTLHASSNVVLMGDFNIVSRTHHPRYTAFRSWEYDALEELSDHGLIDAYAQLHPGQQVHSWVGRKGAGYRYDYAYVSTPLVSRLLRCDYLQSAREQGVTDHAAVRLTIRVGVSKDVGTGGSTGWSATVGPDC